MQKGFFRLMPPDRVFEIIETFSPGQEEGLSLEDALGRVLSQDIYSPSDMPGFLRATMDGYAVRAEDTFGASSTLPAVLEVKGEVRMGKMPEVSIGKGEAVKIATGGMLPQGANGVVMIEFCHHIDDNTIEVEKAISPWENVMQPDDDIRRGEVVLKKGKRLRPQDIGALAGLGIQHLRVYKRPRIAIISTGDEVVPIDRAPAPAQVRDINRYTLSAFCSALGAVPVFLGICPDEFTALRDSLKQGLEVADTIWISGGSSVGTRDLTLKVFESIKGFDLLVHGIAVRPGKPTIIGRIGSKPIVGLPGQVTSAFIVAEVFMSRLIKRLSGEGSPAIGPGIDAIMARNMESSAGREDYIRVRLAREGNEIFADPIIGKSGLISPLVEADGLVRIGINREGLYKGEKVKVIPFISRGVL